MPPFKRPLQRKKKPSKRCGKMSEEKETHLLSTYYIQTTTTWKKKKQSTCTLWVCHLEAKIFLAVVCCAVPSWHTVDGKASKTLTSYPCCTQTPGEANPGYTVGIKVHVRAGVLLTAQGFLQPADLHGCSVRRESHIVEVGYRRGRQQRDERQKNRRIRIDGSVMHRLLWSSLSAESRVATVVRTVWWVNSVGFFFFWSFWPKAKKVPQLIIYLAAH